MNKDEYIIINKTKWLEASENNKKPAPHWDGVYVSDAQNARVELIEELLSQSTPLTPVLQKTWNTAYVDAMSIDEETYKPLFFEDYISNLKLDI